MMSPIIPNASPLTPVCAGTDLFVDCMETRTVTVVTPSYNQGIYLAETIESVIGQEGDFTLDYLIIDGGSRDNSVEIIKRYEGLLASGEWVQRCNGISFRWLSEKDEGQSDAIMKGFRMAKGGILAWLNSDDTYLPGTLNKIVTLFSSEPDFAVVYGKTRYVSESGEEVGSYPTRQFDKKLLPLFNFICQPSVFFRKSVIPDVGGLDLGLNYVMDYEFWIRLARGYRFLYLPEFLSTYRLHEQSKTVSAKTALENATEALSVVLKHYDWAPLNRVYVYCNLLVRRKFSIEKKYIATVLSVLLTPSFYVYFNKGLKLADLRTIKGAILSKLHNNQ